MAWRTGWVGSGYVEDGQHHVARRRLGELRGGCLLHLALLLHVGADELVLGGEVVVEGRLGHAGLGDDPVDAGRMDAFGVEQAGSGLEDAGACVAGCGREAIPTSFDRGRSSKRRRRQPTTEARSRRRRPRWIQACVSHPQDVPTPPSSPALACILGRMAEGCIFCAIVAGTASVQVAGMIRRALDPDGINLVHATGRAAWQTVFHFHLHLVPRHERDGLVPPWSVGQPRAEDASLRAVADKIRSAGEGSGAGE
jgi:HIT domain